MPTIIDATLTDLKSMRDKNIFLLYKKTQINIWQNLKNLQLKKVELALKTHHMFLLERLKPSFAICILILSVKDYSNQILSLACGAVVNINLSTKLIVYS